MDSFRDEWVFEREGGLGSEDIAIMRNKAEKILQAIHEYSAYHNAVHTE